MNSDKSQLTGRKRTLPASKDRDSALASVSNLDNSF